MSRPSRPLISLVALAASLAAALAGPAQASRPAEVSSTAVTRWIELELDAIAANRLNPPRAARALALLSTAMDEAASVGNGRDAAVVDGAASTVLAYLFPGSPVGTPSDEKSFAHGERIAQGLIEEAESDGSGATWTGTAPVGDAFWIPTPPAFVAAPLEPLAGTWRPWNLRSGSQFRPEPPPAYGSAEFLAELDEVYDISQSLTDEQRAIAAFWADGPGTATPAGHWNRIAVELAEDAGWSALEAARAFAALNTAQADAFIASWDAKYAYWSLRPVTAIRRLIDAEWLPPIATPPFPSYVSGHSSTSGAASTVLGAPLPERAEELDALAEEAALSRLYGGIHFASDNVAGLALGRQVGQVAVRAYHLRAGPPAG
jgi:membrane-associated phospholipid phosphatase